MLIKQVLVVAVVVVITPLWVKEHQGKALTAELVLLELVLLTLTVVVVGQAVLAVTA
jgi:hypothetical protein